MSQKATMCEYDYDYLSTGEPITLNFNAGQNDEIATTTIVPPTPDELAEKDNRSSLGGSRRNNFVEDEAGGGEKANS